jgi:DNA-directed RNA polymerase specialized sigma24 family protein
VSRWLESGLLYPVVSIVVADALCVGKSKKHVLQRRYRNHSSCAPALSLVLNSGRRIGVGKMESGGSITFLIGRLVAGDRTAVGPLCERYFHRLVRLARKKLEDSPRLAADEEDVALSAFGSFIRHAEKGEFPDLRDRRSLWKLLVTITARKASHLLRDSAREKRGGSSVVSHQDSDLEQLVGHDLDPEFEVELADQFAHLMCGLDDKTLQAIAQWRMEGYTTFEIAGMLHVAHRTVERKLELIRAIWCEQGTGAE